MIFSFALCASGYSSLSIGESELSSFIESMKETSDSLFVRNDCPAAEQRKTRQQDYPPPDICDNKLFVILIFYYLLDEIRNDNG